MGSIQQNWTENIGVSVSAATWYNTFTMQDAVASLMAGEDEATKTFALPKASASARFVDSNKSLASYNCSLCFRPANYSGSLSVLNKFTSNGSVSWASNETRSLSDSAGETGEYLISDIFNSSNPTVRSVAIRAYGFRLYTQTKGARTSAGYPASTYSMQNGNRPGTDWGDIATLTLDAPPTFTAGAISFSRNAIYAGFTSATVSVSDLSAKYGGSITNVVFKIGEQTAQRTDAGNLTINLDTAGTFTPTVTVTDSRGQTSTKTYDAITVLPYVEPRISFSCERTTQAGAPDDEGESVVVEATFDWTSAVVSLAAPTVVVKDADGVTISATTTWYKTRSSSGALSNAISDWSAVTSADMPIYAFIDNSTHDAFDTEYSYQITITPNDTHGAGTPINQTLGGAFYTVDYLAGGHGIAFGMPATEEGFHCGMSAEFYEVATFDKAVKLDLGAIAYGTSSTAAGTTTKVVTTSIGTFSLTSGQYVLVKFDNTTSTSTSVNVNSTGSKQARYNGSRISSSNGAWSAGDLVIFQYDGTYYNRIMPDDSSLPVDVKLAYNGLLLGWTDCFE